MSRSSELVLVGLSHHTAPIAIREKIAVAEPRLAETLGDLRDLPLIDESVVVSTCNRVEVYAAVKGDAAEAARSIRDYLSSRDRKVDDHLYERRGIDAVRHLFRVCSSLDSMVLGEPQILGQVKDAYATAEAQGAVGRLLSRSCTRAFAVAKKVRTETQVGRAAVSMSFAAVELATKILGSLEGKKVLLIGAGKMSTLAVKHLRRAGVGQVMVVNRSLERATDLVDELGGEAHPWESLAARLVEADVVLCSTAAPQPVVTVDLAVAARKARKHRPLLFIDLAVPRDVDPKVNSLDGIFVYDVDDINQVIGENLRARQEEAARAEEIVSKEANSFLVAWKNEAAPVVRELRQRGEEIAKAEVAKTLSRFGEELDPKQQRALEALGRAIVNKLLHEPTTRLRQAGEQGEGELVAAAAALFGIETGADDLEAASEPDASEGLSAAERPATERAQEPIRIGAPQQGENTVPAEEPAKAPAPAVARQVNEAQVPATHPDPARREPKAAPQGTDPDESGPPPRPLSAAGLVRG